MSGGTGRLAVRPGPVPSAWSHTSSTSKCIVLVSSSQPTVHCRPVTWSGNTLPAAALRGSTRLHSVPLTIRNNTREAGPGGGAITAGSDHPGDLTAGRRASHDVTQRPGDVTGRWAAARVTSRPGSGDVTPVRAAPGIARCSRCSPSHRCTCLPARADGSGQRQAADSRHTNGGTCPGRDETRHCTSSQRPAQ